MDEVDIKIKDCRDHFMAGEEIHGTAELHLPEKIPLENVAISFHCVGEVKWTEYPGTPYSDGYEYYEEVDYLDEVFKFNEKDISIIHHIGHSKVSIPFVFEIPKNKNLPSTMVSPLGQVQYFIRVTVKDKEEVKKYVKGVVVQVPMLKNLMITVAGSAEKKVLLHNGHVSMHASIGRKGFAPGEAITVHVNVDNKTNAKVVPRVALHQVQIYMSGVRHRTVESILSKEPVIGSEIAPHKQEEALLVVKIPSDESLSIKSSVITVKYFVHITLDIPHAFDLHVNLPIVVTAKRIIEELREKKDHEELLAPREKLL